MVINIVGGKNGASELLEEIRFFVGGPVRSDDADGRAAFGVANLAQPLAGEVHGLVPAHRFQLAVGFADERLRKAVFAIGEVKCVTTLDT